MLNFNENVLPYKTFYSGSAYNSNNFCERSKLFAVLHLPANCQKESWYYELKSALKFIKI